MCSFITKTVLVIANLVLLLAGLLVLTFGIVAEVKPQYILTTLGNIPGMSKIPDAIDLGEIITDNATFLFVLGAVVAAVGFLGCCGACCESRPLLIAYIVVLVVVLCAEVVLIILAALAPEKMKATIQGAMQKSMREIKADITLSENGTLKLPTDKISLGWTFLQIGADCCGTFNSSDYGNWARNFTYHGMNLSAAVPISCCAKTRDINLETSDDYDLSIFSNLMACLDGNDTYINQKNCYDSIYDLAIESRNIVIINVALIIGVELVLFILAVVLCNQ